MNIINYAVNFHSEFRKRSIAVYALFANNSQVGINMPTVKFVIVN